MTKFAKDVMAYLKKPLSEEDENKKVCPKCGKNPCVCSNASASTKTAGGDDGDDYTKNASVSNDKDAYFGNKVPADGYTKEEKEILKCIANKIKKQQKEGIKEPADGWTPEEKEIIKLLSGKASVDDHTNGRNGCADTEACAKCDDKEKKNSLKESILDLLNC